MDAGEDQNTGTTNGPPQTSGNSRAPQIAHMSLYERQAVQVCIHYGICVIQRTDDRFLELVLKYINKDSCMIQYVCVCVCQALQALQRQPHAAQYFQQLMLHQQINSAQLHNLAAVQQVSQINMTIIEKVQSQVLNPIPSLSSNQAATLAASRQSNTPSSTTSQATTTVSFVVSCLNYYLHS